MGERRVGAAAPSKRVGSGPRPLVCPVLVGRDDLLELGARRIAAARAGHGQLLLLAGEAGIGKTRLLRALDRKAAAAGARTVAGATFPRDLEVSAAPFIDLARAMALQASLEGTGQRLLGRLAETAEVPSHDAHRRRRLLVLDVAEMLAATARDGPTLIAIEDLHWADDLSLEILAALARRLKDLPLLVVATYRSDELYPRVPMRTWRSRLLTGRLAEEARLARLAPDEVATMTALLLGLHQPAPSDLVAAIAERTDGVPLHVEELLGALAPGGPAPADAIRTAGVPDTLEATVVDRLERRSSAARRVAQAGSVIGRSFDLDLLAALVDLPPDRLDRALAELTDHFFLVPDQVEGRYDFRHAIIRDAIYQRVAITARRRLHRRVAALAEGAGSADDAFLSDHYERAGRRDETFALALRAARGSTALGSRREAFELYRRAIRNLPPEEGAFERARIHEEFARTAAAIDDHAAAADAFETARRAYQEAGEPVAGAAVVAPLVAARHLLGDGLEARVGRLNEALGEVDRATADGADPTVVAVARAHLRAGLSAAYMLDRRLDDAIEHGQAARREAATAGDQAVELDVAATLGAVLVFAGRMDEGWSMLEEATLRARDLQLETEAARGYRMLGTSASVLVEYDRAEGWLADGIEYAERVELWNHRYYLAAHLAHVRWATGAWAEAEEIASQALADGRGGGTTRITALLVLGYIAFGRGEFEGARAALDEAYELGTAMGELQRLSPAMWGLAELALAQDDPVAATGWCERGLGASAAVDDAAYLFPFLVTGVRAWLARRDAPAARRWADEVSERLRFRSIPGTLVAIDHANGLLELASGSLGRARTSLQAAVQGWTAARRTWEGTQARIDLALVHLRSNRPAGAAAVAEAAAAVAEGLGAPFLAKRADQVLRQARVRHPSDAPWAPLTSREYEVARLIADGLTNAAIADRLDLSPRTVGAHVEHILARLGVSRRAEIAAWSAKIEAGSGTSGE